LTKSIILVKEDSKIILEKYLKSCEGQCEIVDEFGLTYYDNMYFAKPNGGWSEIEEMSGEVLGEEFILDMIGNNDAVYYSYSDAYTYNVLYVIRNGQFLKKIEFMDTPEDSINEGRLKWEDTHRLTSSSFFDLISIAETNPEELFEISDGKGIQNDNRDVNSTIKKKERDSNKEDTNNECVNAENDGLSIGDICMKMSARARVAYIVNCIKNYVDELFEDCDLSKLYEYYNIVLNSDDLEYARHLSSYLDTEALHDEEDDFEGWPLSKEECLELAEICPEDEGLEVLMSAISYVLYCFDKEKICSLASTKVSSMQYKINECVEVLEDENVKLPDIEKFLKYAWDENDKLGSKIQLKDFIL